MPSNRTVIFRKDTQTVNRSDTTIQNHAAGIRLLLSLHCSLLTNAVQQLTDCKDGRPYRKLSKSNTIISPSPVVHAKGKSSPPVGAGTAW